jgi:biotin carboxylase
VARVLLLLPTKGYRTHDFLEAAARLGVLVTVGSEEPSALEGLNPEGLLTLDFADPPAAARQAVDFSRRRPIDAVVGVDDETTVAAAAIGEALGLPHNPVESAIAARDKSVMRRLLVAAGVRTPWFRLFSRRVSPHAAAEEVRYPCVLKPTFLSASRGVIRADGPGAFEAAWARIGALLDRPELMRRGGEAAGEILVEEFIPGEEVSLEGLLEEGALRSLALFDKPDPLEGPYFEETLYVTPSRKPPKAQNALLHEAARGCRALGLVDGPVHAELRWNGSAAWIIEIAARSIGGLCSRTLRFGTGASLEELILRHALRMGTADLERRREAAGVMMIPIPRAGILEEVAGVEEARRVQDIEEVTISAHLGQELETLPEGSRYLGFLFSRAPTPERAEAALRQAHLLLRFRIRSADEDAGPKAL